MEYINKIYEQYANLIKNYIFLIVNDKELAEEIMQETFVVAITQINKFRGDCEISTWLCSIAKKILYKKTKRKSKKAIVSIEALQVESNIDVEENYVKNEKKLKFYEVLQTLDAETREIMYLRLTGELTFKEIGKILNKSENWARVKFFRGKQKLNERKEEII